MNPCKFGCSRPIFGKLAGTGSELWSSAKDPGDHGFWKKVVLDITATEQTSAFKICQLLLTARNWVIRSCKMDGQGTYCPRNRLWETKQPDQLSSSWTQVHVDILNEEADFKVRLSSIFSKSLLLFTI
ncbi:hypothetical protein AHF37_01656 [Paragonimus kellicotti]|nr:hypothetical protein AHF37_01656 [Paragonimus kellicotti]